MSEQHTGRGGVDRRAFLRDLAGIGLGTWTLAACARSAASAAGGAASASRAATGAHPVKPAADRIGIQLYTVGDQTRQDFLGTMEKVAQIGYKQFEFAGYGDVPPAQIRATLDRLGVTSPSTHIGMNLLRSDLEKQIAIAQTIGHEYITVPSLGGETPRADADAWKRVAEEFNQMGSTLKGRGLKLGFHSHSGEFVPLGGGKTGMDVFVSETDPSLVTFEMDLGWARVASQDPVQWFDRYPNRFRLWHVKDMTGLATMQARQTAQFNAPPGPRPGGEGGVRPGGGPPQPGTRPATGPAPIGQGDIDYRPILAAWQRAGLEYFFVEQDAADRWPGGSLASIQKSYETLKRLLG